MTTFIASASEKIYPAGVPLQFLRQLESTTSDFFADSRFCTVGFLRSGARA